MTNQTIITSRIKYFQMEYPDGVPLNILKLELDISVEELQTHLLSLEEQGILFIENEEYVKLVEVAGEESSIQDEDSNSLLTTPNKYLNEEPIVKSALTYDLTDQEISSLEIIKDLTDEAGHIPRYLLEGSLLYGDLKMNTLGVYKMIMSLQNKGIIKKIQIKDNEYYSI